jgi:hypothetical protein
MEKQVMHKLFFRIDLVNRFFRMKLQLTHYIPGKITTHGLPVPVFHHVLVETFFQY